MSVPSNAGDLAPMSVAPPDQPRFGGLLWRLSRMTSGLTRPLAGKRWNPIFAIVLHQGRRTGRWYATPVAARRLAGGFVLSLAFGAQVDWYRNLQSAGGGKLRWRGRDYPVGAPDRVEPQTAMAAFNPIQRLALRIGRIDGYVRLPDAVPAR